MKEGLFWVIGSPEEWELLPVFVSSNVINHKDAWAVYIQPSKKCFRQVAYNFYPRGRVVIRNDRATVFLNQHIASEQVVQKVCDAFSLTEPKIHAEGGHHYQCFMDRK